MTDIGPVAKPILSGIKSHTPHCSNHSTSLPESSMLRRISRLRKPRSQGPAAREPPQRASSSNSSLVQVPSTSSVRDVTDVEPVVMGPMEALMTIPVPHVGSTSPLDLPFSIATPMPVPEIYVCIPYDPESVGPHSSRFEEILDDKGSFDTNRSRL